MDVNALTKAPESELAEYCKSKGILVQGYCPLARKNHLNDKTLNAVAGKYNTTPANVMLSWAIAKGYVPLPKVSCCCSELS